MTDLPEEVNAAIDAAIVAALKSKGRDDTREYLAWQIKNAALSALTAEGYMVVRGSSGVFSPDEVANLNAHQARRNFHPFTCENRSDEDHRGGGELVATVNGWICPYCDYRQDWAHNFMKVAPTHYTPLLPAPESE